VKKQVYNRYILVADIGGTNTRIGVMGIKNSKSFHIIFRFNHLTKDIKNIVDLINDTLSYAKEKYNVEVKMSCIGAAGPIPRKRSYIKLTNVDLEINQQEILANTMLTKVLLINDFEAIGYGVDLLDLNRDVVKLPHVGEDLTKGVIPFNTISVIGARSGLGMAIAHYDSIKHLHVPLPSEGGHMSLTPTNELELELVKYLKKNIMIKKDTQPELERVLSAKGIKNIFDFLVFHEKCKDDQLIKEINKLELVEKLSEIEKNYSKNKICKKTIDMFIKYYAIVCSNLTLLSECYSGLFIVDIIALKNIKGIELKRKILMNFMNEFEKHDKRTDVLRKVPVFLITNKDVALYGCCNVAVNFFNIT